MPKTYSPDDVASIENELADLTIEQVLIDTTEGEQKNRRDRRAERVFNLKDRGVPRRMIVDATKHPGRPDGLSVEALDLAVKKWRAGLRQGS